MYNNNNNNMPFLEFPEFRAEKVKLFKILFCHENNDKRKAWTDGNRIYHKDKKKNMNSWKWLRWSGLLFSVLSGEEHTSTISKSGKKKFFFSFSFDINGIFFSCWNIFQMWRHPFKYHLNDVIHDLQWTTKEPLKKCWKLNSF